MPRVGSGALVKEKKAGRGRRTEEKRGGRGLIGKRKNQIRTSIGSPDGIGGTGKPVVFGVGSSEQVYDLFELDAARTLDQNETVAQGMFGEIGTQRFRVCEGPVTRRVGSRESETVAY